MVNGTVEILTNCVHSTIKCSPVISTYTVKCVPSVYGVINSCVTTEQALSNEYGNEFIHFRGFRLPAALGSA